MAATEVLGIVTIDSKGRGSFPQSVREALHLPEGGQVRVERAEDGHLEFVPVAMVPLDQLYFHTAEMRARVERAEQSFAERTSTRTGSEAETLAFLDGLKGRSARTGAADR